MEVKRPETPPPLSRVAEPRSSSGANLSQTQPKPQPRRADASASIQPRARNQIGPVIPPPPRRTPGSRFEGERGSGSYGSQPERGQPQPQDNMGGFWTQEDMERNSRLTTAVEPEQLFQLPEPPAKAARSGGIGAKFKTLISRGDGKAKSGNANAQSEFARITEAQLKSMRVADLEAIYRDAASQCERADGDPSAALVRDMAAKVLRNLNPALSPVLLQMLRDVGNPAPLPGEPRDAAIARGFAHVLMFASQQDASQYDSTKSVSQAPYEVVLDAMAYLMTQDVSADEMLALLHALPPAELITLSNVNDVVGHGTLNRALMVKFARQAAAAMQAAELRLFNDAVDDASNWRHDSATHRLLDAPRLVDTVIQAGNHLGRFQSCGGQVDERTYLATQNQLGGVLALLAYADNVSTVPLPQLKHLAAALKTLHFDGDFGIAAEMKGREQATSDARKLISGQVIELLRDVKDKSPAETVRAIRRALDQRMVSGLKPGTFADELRQFTSELPPATLRELRASMSSHEIATLGAVLTEVSRTGTVKEFVGLSRELDEIASVLAAVRDAVSPSVNSTSEGSWPVIDKLDGILQTPAMRELLSSLCISVYEGELTVHLAAAPLSFQAAADGAVKSLRVSESDAPFALDARQGTVTINSLGASQAQLVELAGGNPRVLDTLAQVLSRQAWEGVDGLLQTPDTPFHMGSTPVEYLGTHSCEFDVRSDNRGGLIVARSLKITRVREAKPIQPGPPRQLHVHIPAGAPPTIVTKIAISATGLATPLGSAQVSSQFSVVEWDGRYPRPLDVSEITAPGAPPKMLEEFVNFLNGEHSEENAEFFAAMNSFDTNPTLASAQDLATTFIAQGAKSEINISAFVRQNIQRALADPGARNMSPDDLIALFAPARREITSLVQRDTFERYRKQIAPERRPTPDAAVAVAAEIPAEAGDSVDTKVPARDIVDVRVRQLTALLRTSADVDLRISNLISSMARKPDDYWGELNDHVQSVMRSLDSTAIASLLINLSKSTHPPYAGHVKLLREAALSRLNAVNERLVRMTPEGVLAESPYGLPSEQLRTWFDSGRITAYELFTALKGATAAELRKAAQTRTSDGQFQLIAQRVIAAQTRELEGARQQLETAFADMTTSQAPITDPTLSTLKLLANRLTGFEALRTKLGDPSAGADRVIERARSLLAERLVRELAKPAPRLTASEVGAHRDTLITLGVTTDALAACVGQLRVRESAARARLQNQEALPSSQAHIPPRPPQQRAIPQDVPPPPELPPDNDDIPPPPDDPAA